MNNHRFRCLIKEVIGELIKRGATIYIGFPNVDIYDAQSSGSSGKNNKNIIVGNMMNIEPSTLNCVIMAPGGNGTKMEMERFKDFALLDKFR